MPLWGLTDTANNAPKHAILDNATANGETMYGNTTVNSFISKQVVGVFGVDAAEAALSRKVSGPGWHKVIMGTGPVTQFAVANGGADYAPTDKILVTQTGAANIEGVITVNANGTITAAAVPAFGGNFTNTAAVTVAVVAANGAAANGTGANVSITLGGRAGRVSYECLVAAHLSGDGSDDTIFPDS